MAKLRFLTSLCLTAACTLSACADPLASREDEGAPGTASAGANYGDDRIGYKGSALSNAASLTGDQTTLGGASSGSGSFAGGGTFSGGFAGGASAPVNTGFAGGAIGGGSAPPGAYPASMDAGLAPPIEAGPSEAGSIEAGPIDAGPIDAAQPPDTAVTQLDGSADAFVADAGSGYAVDASVGSGDAIVNRPEDAYVPNPTPWEAATPSAPIRVDFGGILPTTPDAAVAAEVLPENPFQLTSQNAASTFAIDVDTGSYTLSRASINAGQLPAPKSVRVEEFLNYFHFHYAQPEADVPFSVYTELGACPWNSERQLLLLGIQGQEVELVDQPPANLVFLIDTSGSMASQEKLPLLKKGFRMLASQLRDQDKVSIVTYAGNAAVVLEGVAGSRRQEVMSAIQRMESSGSTNGAGGIQKAYELAERHFVKGGNNRVILATDGDFNVGISSTPALVEMIAAKRKTGVQLSVYGFGAAWNGGNYKDEVGEQLADNGDGIYFYIDSPEEARRAFIESISGSLLTVAKDVKVQVEMNPQWVKAYRLIGYENRVLTNASFSNDKVDGGELGAGLSVTALFEIIPAGASGAVPAALPGSVPPLGGADAGSASAETFEPVMGANLLEVRLRYKEGLESKSKLVREFYTRDIFQPKATRKFQFATGVAELSMQLRGSQYLGKRRTGELLDQIGSARPLDTEGAIEELLQLAKKAQELGLGR